MKVASTMNFYTAPIAPNEEVRKVQESEREKETSENQSEDRPKISSKSNRDTYIPGNRAEKCTVSTDQVDREIEMLKKEKGKLEQQIHAESDETKSRELEKRLEQVEQELRQKDNDTYRRQHAVYTRA